MPLERNTTSQRWTRDDFAHDAATIARALLGQRLIRIIDNQPPIIAIITETEAYLGPEDLASHARNNLRTQRNESMWAAPGTAYVYFTYGMHHCFNVACLKPDHPAAVLIRSVQPIAGLDQLRANRARASRARQPLQDAQLANGPAKLCQALAIDAKHNGIDLTTSRQLWIEHAPPIPLSRVIAGPRVGVAYAGEWAAKPLRFMIARQRATDAPSGSTSRAREEAAFHD